MSSIVLDVQALTMQFGGLKAVSDLSLQIPQGAIFGLIGKNLTSLPFSQLIMFNIF